MMQEYICKDCDDIKIVLGVEVSKKGFYFQTKFLFAVENPFCPNCGSDQHTEYLGDCKP